VLPSEARQPAGRRTATSVAIASETDQPRRRTRGIEEPGRRRARRVRVRAIRVCASTSVKLLPTLGRTRRAKWALKGSRAVRGSTSGRADADRILKTQATRGSTVRATVAAPHTPETARPHAAPRTTTSAPAAQALSHQQHDTTSAFEIVACASRVCVLTNSPECATMKSHRAPGRRAAARSWGHLAVEGRRLDERCRRAASQICGRRACKLLLRHFAPKQSKAESIDRAPGSGARILLDPATP